MQSPRVVSVSLEVPHSAELPPNADRVEYNLDNICESLDRAAQWNPDFVLYPEFMLHRWCTTDEMDATAQSVPGPATNRVSALAAEIETYVWLPLQERDSKHRYNAIVLIDPNGDLVGCYRKLRPTAGEIDSGTSPGIDLPTWETPFGRVGGLICFDLKYPELAVDLARQGANLLFFASHLQGRTRMAHWAREYGLHIVKAHQSTAEIVTPTGESFAHNTGRWPGQDPLHELDAGGEARFAFAEINPDWEVFGRTPENRAAVKEIQSDGRDVVYHDFSDDETFALECREDSIPLTEITAEYGLERYRDWLDRNVRAALEAKKNMPGESSEKQKLSEPRDNI